MYDRIKANRQTIQYYEAAQDLLDLAKNEAGDFISDHEDAVITGQQFKHETNGWINRLDDIIQDLSKQPDPLNLVPKARQLKKNLQQVVSQPADEITYDMMNANGRQRNGKNGFWTKIQNLFSSIMSDEPKIIRASNQREPDFVLPQAGHLTSVEQKRRTSASPSYAIPAKPKQRQMVAPKPSNTPLGRRQEEAKPSTVAKPRDDEDTITLHQEMQLKEQIAREEKARQETEELARLDMELHNKILEQQQVTEEKTKQKDLSSEDLDRLVEQARKIAFSIGNDLGKKAELIKNEAVAYSAERDNISSSDLIQALSNMLEANSTNISERYGDLNNQFRSYLNSIDSSNFSKFMNGKGFFANYMTRDVQSSGGTYTLGEIQNEMTSAYDALNSNPFIGKRISGNPRLFASIQEDVSRTINQVRTMDRALDAFSGTNNVQAISRPEFNTAGRYNTIAYSLKDKNSDIYKYYSRMLNSIYHANGGNPKISINKSLERLAIEGTGEGLFKRIAGTGGSSNEVLIEEIIKRRSQGKSFPIKYSSAPTQTSPKQINSIIQLIEKSIEEPVRDKDFDHIGENAGILYSQLDKYATSLESDSVTERAASSINKLKNRLLKVVRNAKELMSPQFQGDIIRSSQIAIQDLDLAAVDIKHLDTVVAKPRQVLQSKPAIPAKPKQRQMVGPVDRQQVDRQAVQENKPKQNNPEKDEIIYLDSVQDSDDFKNAIKRSIDIARKEKTEAINDKKPVEQIKADITSLRSTIFNQNLKIKNAFLLFIDSNQRNGKDQKIDDQNRDILYNALGLLITETQKIIDKIEKLTEANIAMLHDINQLDFFEQKDNLISHNSILSKYYQGFKSVKTSGQKERWKDGVEESVKSVIDASDAVIDALDAISGYYDEDFEAFDYYVDEISNPHSGFREIFLEDHYKPNMTDAELFQAMQLIIGDPGGW